MAKVLVKLLNQLEITQTDFRKLKDMQTLLTQLTDMIKEKLVLKSLEKFGTFLKTSLSNAPDEEEPEDDMMNKTETEVTQISTDDSSSTKTGGKKRALFNQTTNILLPTPAARKWNNNS